MIIWLMTYLLNISYGTNIMFFSILTNLLDEKYETARDYSQMDRSFNFGIKNSF